MARKIQTQGIHHITLNGADRQTSIDFWEGVLGMALLAELCALFFQQSFVNRTVCAVTQAAVFCHRIVLPKIGATLLRMTLVTVVIQA